MYLYAHLATVFVRLTYTTWQRPPRATKLPFPPFLLFPPSPLTTINTVYNPRPGFLYRRFLMDVQRIRRRVSANARGLVARVRGLRAFRGLRGHGRRHRRQVRRSDFVSQESLVDSEVMGINVFPTGRQSARNSGAAAPQGAVVGSSTHENDGIGRTMSVITATRGEGDLPPPTGNRIRCVTEVTVTSERLDGGSDPSVGSASDGTESHQIVDDTIPTIVVSSASTSSLEGPHVASVEIISGREDDEQVLLAVPTEQVDEPEETEETTAQAAPVEPLTEVKSIDEPALQAASIEPTSETPHSEETVVENASSPATVAGPSTQVPPSNQGHIEMLQSSIMAALIDHDQATIIQQALAAIEHLGPSSVATTEDQMIALLRASFSVNSVYALFLFVAAHHYRAHPGHSDFLDWSEPPENFPQLEYTPLHENQLFPDEGATWRIPGAERFPHQNFGHVRPLSNNWLAGPFMRVRCQGHLFFVPRLLVMHYTWWQNLFQNPVGPDGTHNVDHIDHDIFNVLMQCLVSPGGFSGYEADMNLVKLVLALELSIKLDMENESQKLLYSLPTYMTRRIFYHDPHRPDFSGQLNEAYFVYRSEEIYRAFMVLMNSDVAELSEYIAETDLAKIYTLVIPEEMWPALTANFSAYFCQIIDSMPENAELPPAEEFPQHWWFRVRQTGIFHNTWVRDYPHLLNPHIYQSHQPNDGPPPPYQAAFHEGPNNVQTFMTANAASDVPSGTNNTFPSADNSQVVTLSSDDGQPQPEDGQGMGTEFIHYILPDDGPEDIFITEIHLEDLEEGPGLFELDLD
ncbi:hypothetical protein HJFPF1_06892 [Paramyrothecium foliicola]|nr:hypothetical protein HJFPF1_06892 [Paramyrothecium foliicola]